MEYILIWLFASISYRCDRLTFLIEVIVHVCMTVKWRKFDHWIPFQAYVIVL